MKPTATNSSAPIILYLLVTLSPLGIDLHLPALVELRDYFHISNQLAQLSIVTFVFSMGVGQLLFGFLSENYGKKKTAYLGALLFIFSSACILFVSDYYLVICFRIMQGLGASALSVIAYATVNENYKDDEAAIIFSIQSGFLNIIPAVAPVLGVALLGVWGWKMIFLFFTVYGIVILLQIVKQYHYPQRSVKHHYSKAIFSLLKDKQFWLYSSVCVFGLGFIMTYLNIAPILMMGEFKVSTFMFALCFAVNASIISIVSFALKKIIVYLGVMRCVVMGIFLVTVSSAGLFLLNTNISLLTFWIFIVVGSVGFALAFGPSISLSLSNHQAYSGVASGVLGFIYLSLSPLIAFGILQYGEVNTGLMGGVFTVSGAFLLVLLIKTKYKSNQVEQCDS